MSRLTLSIATTDYDHFRDFRLGLVTAEGIDHTWLNARSPRMFRALHREPRVRRRRSCRSRSSRRRSAATTADIVGLPVICSRLFRFSSFYVNKKSGIKTVEDLKGKRVGSPEWAHSAAVYMRGWMHNDMGVKLTDVHWYQAGANAPGREEKVELNLPAGVKLTRVPDKSLSEMLAAHEIDCAIIARPPTCFLEGHPDVVRLFPDYLRDGGGILRAHEGLADHAHHRDEEVASSTSTPGRRAISTTRFSNRSAARSSASSIPPCRAIPCRGSRPTRAGCATCSAAICFRTASRRTARPGNRWRSTPYQQGIAHRLMKPEEILPDGHHDEGRDLTRARASAPSAYT